MGIIELLVLVALIFFLAWVLIRFIPMPEPGPKIVIGVAIVIVVLLVLSTFGILPAINRPVPQLR